MSNRACAACLFIGPGLLLLTQCSDAAIEAPGSATAGAAPSAGTSSNAGSGGVAAGAGGAAAPGGTTSVSAGGSAAGSLGVAGAVSVGGAAGASTAGAGGAAGTGGTAGQAGTAAGGSAFAITSSEHAEGAPFASALTCAGDGRSPALAWTAGPAGTQSYAITFFDETLVATNNVNGYHWVIWDIPSTTLALPASLPSGAMLSTPVTAKQLSPLNNFDHLPANTYFGPCPNAIGGTSNNDTYAFTIYALNVPNLTGTLTSVKNVEAAIKAATPLAKASLTGTSNAKPN
jgi:Raf kinase inhibitor-like YbhB/YbcL family protein